MTTDKLQVIEDAKKAGYEIKESAGCVAIRRMSKHKSPRVLQGIIIYPDGIAFDLTIQDVSDARAIRSASAIRATLGI